MDFMAIGTISSFVKNLTLDMKWQERKQKINSQKDEELSPQIANIKKWAEDQRRSQKISAINGKMLSGAYLSEDEIDYLRTNCPDLYAKAVQIKREREAYKKELNNCKSKEDVEKLRQRKMSEFINEANSIATNPNIPKAKKSVLLEFITMRMNAIINDHADFIKSPEYQRLPEKTNENNHESNDNNIDDINTKIEKEQPDDPLKVIQDMISNISTQESGETVLENGSNPTLVYTNAIHAYNAHAKQSFKPIANSATMAKQTKSTK